MEIDGKPKKLSWRDLEVLTDSFSKENFIMVLFMMLDQRILFSTLLKKVGELMWIL